MGMSDCEKCWETPCSCGWGYRDWARGRREELAAAAMGVSVEELRSVIRAPEKHPKFERVKIHNEESNFFK